MRGAPTTFWGKLQKDNADLVIAWHPLVDHSADVASVTEALLALPVWRRRLARLIGRTDLSASVVARLGVLSALHDLGKFNLGFQAKGRSDLRVAPAGHVKEAVSAIVQNEAVNGALAPLAGFGEAAQGLLLSAICHHGQPHRDGADQESRWRSAGGLNPLAGIRDLVSQVQRWFPEAFALGADELPPEPQLEHGFAGLVMLADWVGSTERFFPFSSGTGADRMTFARKRATDVVASLSLAVPDSLRIDSRARAAFDRISSYRPSCAQREIVALPVALEGSIVILEAETGSGKTEAALAHFVSLLSAGAVDGLYFALPTRTAATQIFERVRAAAARAFDQPPPVVLAVPGYLRVDDDEGVRLPGFEVLWPDAERFRFRGWAAEMPKRYLAGAIVVGTVDQVLLSSLLVGHAHLRATSLLRHLLVVDEVHASDAYTTRILEDVLARQLRAGGHALLLSATLTAEAREHLLGCDGKPSLADSIGSTYPLVTFKAVGGDVQRRAVAFDGRIRQIGMRAVPLMEDAGLLVGEALAAASAGAKVLVLRNTVADCVATQVALEELAGSDSPLLFRCAGRPAPHHGRFARGDRIALDGALEARIGKSRADGGCVVVATQTVQQSLDIDVDVMWTDLCPVDVLLQRAGRVHRHERARLAQFAQPRISVLVPAQRDLSQLVGRTGRPRSHHGLGTVYDDLRALDATWSCIESTPQWEIPAMARKLVEQCLHSEALAQVVSRAEGRLDVHRDFCVGQGLGERRFAELNVVNWTKPYSEMEFPSGQRFPTRLGEGDRLVQFVDAGPPGPFGERVAQLSLPAYWCRGVPDEAEAEAVSAIDRVLRFEFGARRFVYDRLGLRPEAPASFASEGVENDDGP